MTRSVLPALAGLMLLTGCEAMDPYSRPGMWQPSGAPQGNLAVMLANPYDLVRGRGSDAPERKLGTDPVLRLWDDHVKPFVGAGNGQQPVGAAGELPPGPAGAPPAAGN